MNSDRPPPIYPVLTGMKSGAPAVMVGAWSQQDHPTGRGTRTATRGANLETHHLLIHPPREPG